MRCCKPLILLSISLSAFGLIGCGNGVTADDGSPHGRSLTNSQGIPYISNDTRVINAQPQTPATTPTQPNPQPQAPQKPAPGPTPAPVQTAPAESLQQRMREFEISRYDSTDSSTATRFGSKVVQIKVFFDDAAPAIFKANLAVTHASAFNVNAKSGRYTLKGNLTDDAPYDTLGEFVITDTKTGEANTLEYQAYKATLRFRENATKPIVAGSQTDIVLKELRDNTFGWVNNWAVMNSQAQYRAFYLIDIIKLVSSSWNSNMSNVLFSGFKGEALQTGDHQHAAQTVGGDGKSQVTLVGLGEDSEFKLFSVKIGDDEFMIDVTRELKPSEIPPTALTQDDVPPIQDTGDYEDTPDPSQDQSQNQGNSQDQTQTPDLNSNGNDSSATNTTTLANNRPQRPHQTAPQKPTKPNTGNRTQTSSSNPSNKPQVQTTGTAFLRIDSSTTRSARMIRDFNSNRGLTKVRAWVREFQGGSRSLLSAYYRYANPFRRMLQAISHTYDVAPAYAYLPVNESKYFYNGSNGTYWNFELGDYDKGVYNAYGPFQMHPDAAHDSGMIYTYKRATDERYYFGPSACGAAKYLASNVDQISHWTSDTTLGILAYNQGAGGARTLAVNFGYTFKEMAAASAISKDNIDYVSKILAVFLISSNMPAYGFSVPSDAMTSLPRNGSILPPSGVIHDQTCQAIVKSYF